jgi:hypothetical protein
MNKTINVAFAILLTVFFPVQSTLAEDSKYDMSLGVYGGQFYKPHPEALLTGQKTEFKDQYISSLVFTKTLWQSASYPLSVEIEGVLSYQFGVASLGEIGVVPVLRWDGFPWNEYLKTDFRFGPIGLSYTSSVSPMERNEKGGSQWLNFLIVELGFSLPSSKEKEMFIRLHHRCSIFNTMNDYGTNGEDFLAVGFRSYF